MISRGLRLCDTLYMYADMRAEMKTFWETQSQKSSADIFPSELTDEEVPEVISLLPDLQGKDVLELGAGPGYVTLITVTS